MLETEKSPILIAIEEAKVKEAKVRNRVIAFTLLPVAAILVLIVYLTSEANKVQKRIDELTTQETAKIEALGDKEKELETLNKHYDNLKFTALYSFGWPIDSIKKVDLKAEPVEEAMKANNEIRELLVAGVRYDSIDVLYMNKTLDNGKISQSLKDFGFNFRDKKSSGFWEKNTTNTIIYGHGVTKEQLQLLGYILIRAGVGVKAILGGRSRTKENEVKILTVNRSFKGGVLKVEELQKGMFYNKGDSTNPDMWVVR